MNIKVAAFTVSEKSSNIYFDWFYWPDEYLRQQFVPKLNIYYQRNVGLKFD